jgi:hypothetical protein
MCNNQNKNVETRVTLDSLKTRALNVVSVVNTTINQIKTNQTSNSNSNDKSK